MSNELVQTEDRAVEAVTERVSQAQAQAEAVQVTTAEEANAAAEILGKIAAAKRESEKERKELVGPLNETVKRINARFKDGVAPLDAADAIVRGKVGAYHDEQERLRAEEARRQEAERQERLRVEREAQEKAEAEERAKAEAAAREAREAEALAAESKDAEDRRVAEQMAEEARLAAAKAEVEAQEIANRPEPELPDVEVAAPAPIASETSRVSVRKVWKFDVVDAARVPERYKLVDEKAIREAMRHGVKTEGKPPEIPGVVFRQDDELAVGGRR